MKICDLRVQKAGNVLRLFRTFEATVEHLELQFLKVGLTASFSQKLGNFYFKRLKSLVLFHCEPKICEGIINQCTLLEFLNCRTFITRNVEVFRQLAPLKSLHVEPNFFTMIKSNDITEFMFKLEQLSISYFTSYPTFTDNNVMIEFLKAQSKSLITLNLGDWFGMKVLNLAFKMRALKNLKIENTWEITWVDLIECANPSIEFLDIAPLNSKNITERILRNVPNLKKLRILSVDMKLANLMAVHLKKLQKVQSVLSFSQHVNDIRKILPNVEFT